MNEKNNPNCLFIMLEDERYEASCGDLLPDRCQQIKEILNLLAIQNQILISTFFGGPNTHKN